MGLDMSKFPQEESSEHATVIHSEKEWKEQLEKASSKLMVIDFTATWCGPCQVMAPIFNELAAKFKDVIFVKIDVDKLPSVAKEYQIEAMPTFLFMKNGKEVDKVVGANKASLEAMIEKNMS